MGRTGRLATSAALALTTVVAIFASPASPAGAAPTTLTLNITSLTEITPIEDGVLDGTCYGDYEYRISIDGNSFTKPEFSLDPGFGDGCVLNHPFTFPTDLASFTASAVVDDADVGVLVTIKIVDIDDIFDDTLDISPDPDEKILRLSVDPVTARPRACTAP